MVLIKRYRNGKVFNPQPPPKKEVAPSRTPSQTKPKKEIKRSAPSKKIIKANRPSPRRKGGCGCGGRRR